MAYLFVHLRNTQIDWAKYVCSGLSAPLSKLRLSCFVFSLFISFFRAGCLHFCSMKCIIVIVSSSLTIKTKIGTGNPSVLPRFRLRFHFFFFFLFCFNESIWQFTPNCAIKEHILLGSLWQGRSLLFISTNSARRGQLILINKLWLALTFSSVMGALGTGLDAWELAQWQLPLKGYNKNSVAYAEVLAACVAMPIDFA